MLNLFLDLALFFLVVFGSIAFAIAAFLTLYFGWPAVIRTKPRTPGAMWAYMMLHPKTRGDWSVSGDHGRGSCSNSKLGARVSWAPREFLSDQPRLTTPFELSWRDTRRLDYALYWLIRAKLKRDFAAELEKTVGQIEEAYSRKAIR